MRINFRKVTLEIGSKNDVNGIKKRRNMSNTNYWDCTVEKKLLPMLEAKQCYTKNDIAIRSFELRSEYGEGIYRDYSFDGIHLSYFDAKLKEDLFIKGECRYDALILSLLVRGEQQICFKQNNQSVTCESQESFMAYLNEVCGSCTYFKNKPIKELKIRMSASFLKKHRLLEDAEKTLLSIQHRGPLPFSSKTEDIIAEILSEDHNFDSKRYFLESKILELIATQINEHLNRQQVALPVDNTMKKVYEVERVISGDLSAQYSIAQLALIIGLNAFTLKKEFKRIFGKTIFEYTLQLRMKKASELLTHTEKPIYDISEQVGYKNPTHFTAAFKKFYQLTPKQYRKETNVQA